MRLRDYLDIRLGADGKRCPVKALSYAEAKAIGVPYPLCKGCSRRYANLAVPDKLVIHALIGETMWRG